MSASSATGQYVTLGLGEEVFAVPVGCVREILDYRRPFAIPEGPAYLLGVTDVRGEPTPTLDLRRKLGLAPIEPTPLTRILVLDVPLGDRTLTLGLVADRVIEVAAITSDEIGPPPDIGTPWRSDYIEGVARREGGFVVIFDLARLFTSQEAAALPALAEAG